MIELTKKQIEQISKQFKDIFLKIRKISFNEAFEIHPVKIVETPSVTEKRLELITICLIYCYLYPNQLLGKIENDVFQFSSNLNFIFQTYQTHYAILDLKQIGNDIHWLIDNNFIELNDRYEVIKKINFAFSPSGTTQSKGYKRKLEDSNSNPTITLKEHNHVKTLLHEAKLENDRLKKQLSSMREQAQETKKLKEENLKLLKTISEKDAVITRNNNLILDKTNLIGTILQANLELQTQLNKALSNPEDNTQNSTSNEVVGETLKDTKNLPKLPLFFAPENYMQTSETTITKKVLSGTTNQPPAPPKQPTNRTKSQP